MRVVRLPDAPPRVPAAPLRHAVEAAMDALGVPPEASLTLVLAGDETLRRLNRRHRAIDAPTDVLSFVADEPRVAAGQAAGAYLGDVIVSVDYAARTAHATHRPRGDELRLLAVHGLLHLLGHDDADEAGAEAMRVIERDLGVRAD